jgi:hypothetical protein
VDETHRLNQRANQPSGVLNAKFTAITRALFGADDISKTQLDWIRAKSRHQIFLLDAAQSVRPADLPAELLSTLVAESRAAERYFQLQTQMRIQAGSDFVSYIRRILDPRPHAEPPARQDFGTYDFHAFDDVAAMRAAIFHRNAEAGLARMVAGYAWRGTASGTRPHSTLRSGRRACVGTVPRRIGLRRRTRSRRWDRSIRCRDTT